MSTHLVELGDSRLNTYLQAWVTHALTTNPAQLFNTNMYYPTKNTLAGSENLLGNQWLFAPVYLISGNPVLATNLVILASFFLSALTMYLLVRTITQEPMGAGMAGFVYAFALPRVAQMDHMQLLSMQWIPLIVLFLYLFALRRRTSELMAVCGFLTLQILCSLYLGYLAVLVAGCYLAAVVLIRRELITNRNIRSLVLGALLTAIVIVPIGVNYERWGKSALLTPSLLRGWAIAGSADPWSSYLEVTGFPHNIYQRLLERYHSEELVSEKRLFMGFIPMTLALVGVLCVWFHRHRSQGVPDKPYHATVELSSLSFPFIIGSILTSTCAYVFSLGPYLRIHDRPSHLRLPYGLLQRFVPGMGSFRVPARFGLAVLFGVAVLAGFGFMSLVNAGFLRKRLIFRTALFLTLLVAISFEFKTTPMELAPVMGPKQVFPEYQWLKAQSQGLVTLELPISGSPEQADPFEEAGYVYASVYHWQPLMNGYTGNPPQVFSRTLHLARQMPDAAAVEALAGLGLRCVIVHFDRLPPAELRLWLGLSSSTALHEVAHFEDGAAIYAVARSSH